ncbi:MAG: hypothetical protein ACOCV3_03725, partial [Halanaerobiales bacterium]
MGRQPISWSYGALINPVDFDIGAEVMDESTTNKYRDGLRFYMPLDWDSSLEVISVPELDSNNSYKGTKWGMRTRTTVAGYDLSANFIRDESVKEKYQDLQNDPQLAKNRLGVSLKGDLGPLGAYSAVSYKPIKNYDDQYIYQIGLDYSRPVNYSQRLYLQGEILNLDSRKFLNVLHDMSDNALEGYELNSEQTSVQEIFQQDRLNLFLGNVNYSLDNFSELGLIAAASLDDDSFMLSPRYSNQLPGQLTV